MSDMIKIKRGDTLPKMTATLSDSAGPFDLTDATVKFIYRNVATGVVVKKDTATTKPCVPMLSPEESEKYSVWEEMPLEVLGEGLPVTLAINAESRCFEQLADLFAHKPDLALLLGARRVILETVAAELLREEMLADLWSELQ